MLIISTESGKNPFEKDRQLLTAAYLVRHNFTHQQEAQVPRPVMSHYDNGDTRRGGFAYSYGRSYAMPGRVERVKGSSLRDMFLPTLNLIGRNLLRNQHSHDSVCGQLKHYGVDFDVSKISGNRTRHLQKDLEAGECDKVPSRITKLREQLHTEWLNQLTPNQLFGYPEWVTERYSLSSGQPDRTKTTTVVGIPFHLSGLSHDVENMHKAASKVTGLHQETGIGPLHGLDLVALSKVARGHATKEKKELQTEEEDPENKRQSRHEDYLKSLKLRTSRDSQPYSPVGSYNVDCQEIEEHYLDQKTNLSLDIRLTRTPGIFQASFNFGTFEGAMIVSADLKALEEYCSQLDRKGSDDEDEDEDKEEVDFEDEFESNRKPDKRHKRNVGVLRGRGRPPKKPKVEVQPRTYLLRLKCQDMGSSQIYPNIEKGSVKFIDESLSSLIGKVTLPWIGRQYLSARERCPKRLLALIIHGLNILTLHTSMPIQIDGRSIRGIVHRAGRGEEVPVVKASQHLHSGMYFSTKSLEGISN